MNKLKNLIFNKKKFSPTRFIVFGVIGVILTGAFLLMLPISSRSGNTTNFITALFTSTSATCVTGLVIKDTYLYWSPFGQAVILLLIQIGGLGFMSMATLLSFLLGRTITMRERLVMINSFNLNDLSGIVRLTKQILLGTLFFEGAGALILSIRFVGEYGFWGGVAKGVFHSVSAFCNAGFDILGMNGAFTNLTTYATDPVINFTIMSLIVIGGLGFFVWNDISRQRGLKRLELHTKIVLIATAILIFSGALLFLLFEYNNPGTMGGLSPFNKVMASFFQSVTTRTAGYNTVSQSALTGPSKALSILLMFIGGSPGSTAGGIKTVTAGVLFLTALSVIRGKSSVSAFGRRIGFIPIANALTVLIIAFCSVLAGSMIISVVDGVSYEAALFEAVSALGTVGLSEGLTPSLSWGSHLVLIFLMYFGRVGILTLGAATLFKKSEPIKYPEGKVMIG